MSSRITFTWMVVAWVLFWCRLSIVVGFYYTSNEKAALQPVQTPAVVIDYLTVKSRREKPVRGRRDNVHCYF